MLVVIDPNNPTGAVYPSSTRRALIDLAEQHNLTILADEVYADLGFEGTVPLLGALEPDAPIISFSSLSKAYLAPGWRAGWMVVGTTPRLNNVLAAAMKLADGRLCSAGPMQFAVTAALEGDRSHQAVFQRALADRAGLTTQALNAIPGMRCVPPKAAFYAMPMVSLPPGRTDEDYVLALVEGNRDPLRLRIRLRHARRTGFLPHRLSRRPGELSPNLRRYRRFHPGLSRGRLMPCLPALTPLAP